MLTVLSSSSLLPARFVHFHPGEDSEDLVLEEPVELDIGENLLGIALLHGHTTINRHCTDAVALKIATSTVQKVRAWTCLCTCSCAK